MDARKQDGSFTTNQRSPQLEPPLYVDPLRTALSISISNEPQKL